MDHSVSVMCVFLWQLGYWIWRWRLHPHCPQQRQYVWHCKLCLLPNHVGQINRSILLDFFITFISSMFLNQMFLMIYLYLKCYCFTKYIDFILEQTFLYRRWNCHENMILPHWIYKWLFISATSPQTISHEVSKDFQNWYTTSSYDWHVDCHDSKPLVG